MNIYLEQEDDEESPTMVIAGCVGHCLSLLIHCLSLPCVH